MMRCSRHPHLTTAPRRLDAFCKGRKRTPELHTMAIRAPVMSRALGDPDLYLGGLHLSGGPPLSSQLGGDVFFCSFVSCASSTSCSEYLHTAYEIGLIMTDSHMIVNFGKAGKDAPPVTMETVSFVVEFSHLTERVHAPLIPSVRSLSERPVVPLKCPC